MKTLVVEDDPETALYVTEGLQKHGHTVCWAPTGTDGFEQARAGDCALIIVDRMLPGLDGLTLCRDNEFGAFVSQPVKKWNAG